MPPAALKPTIPSLSFRPCGRRRTRRSRGIPALRQFPARLHNQPAGTWSDGTSLTLCLAGSLSRGFNLGDIARSFIKRYADNYRDAVLKAVNPGDDTGAAYGLDAIPTEWIETLAGAGEIRRIAGAPAAAYTE